MGEGIKIPPFYFVFSPQITIFAKTLKNISMKKPKWYHYLMAAGEQDPDNPNPQLYSPSERAQAYADKDNKKLHQIHSEQFELDKTLAKNKAKVAAYSLTYASNPVIASFATLGLEDLRNIYHRSTQPLDSPRPAS